MNDIAIIGLGYVGLPLAIEFGKKRTTYGFDINNKRILELNECIDTTQEVCESDFEQAKNLIFTNNIQDLKKCKYFIITVPTPINDDKTPDLSFIISVTESLSKIIKKGSVLIYESTVFPGCTEDICIPIINKISGFKLNEEFFVGYSPERINPGDKNNKLTSIVKVTSGSNPEIAIEIDNLYKSIITAGTHMASSIKVAEASKAIENAQRDLNISFMNEIAIIFDKLSINTNEVLEAAGTKWNFLKYQPGLVGGHCIGVDPYYLTHIAAKNDYYPEVILSGRRINENMGKFIAEKIVRLLIKQSFPVSNSNVLILGFSFKENCSDIRNTGVYKLYKNLLEYRTNITIHDPNVSEEEVFEEYGIKLKKDISKMKFDAIIIAVPHNVFLNYDFNDFKSKKESILFDVKSLVKRNNLNFIVNGEL